MAYHHVSGPDLASRLKSDACRKVPLVFVGGCVKYLCTLGECVPSRPPRPPPKEREKQLLFSRPPASQRKCLLKGLVRVFCCYLGSKCFLTLITPWSQSGSSVGFPRQEYCSELPFPSPGDLPDPGIEPSRLHCQADSLPLSYQGKQSVFIGSQAFGPHSVVKKLPFIPVSFPSLPQTMVRKLDFFWPSPALWSIII